MQDDNTYFSRAVQSLLAHYLLFPVHWQIDVKKGFNYVGVLVVEIRNDWLSFLGKSPFRPRVLVTIQSLRGLHNAQPSVRCSNPAFMQNDSQRDDLKRVCIAMPLDVKESVALNGGLSDKPYPT